MLRMLTIFLKKSSLPIAFEMIQINQSFFRFKTIFHFSLDIHWKIYYKFNELCDSANCGLDMAGGDS